MKDLIKRYLETKDEVLFEQILDKYMPMIYKTTLKFKHKHSYEDLVNTGRMAVYEAVLNYDEKRSSFTTHVFNMIEGRIKDELINVYGFNQYYNTRVGIKPLYLSLDDEDTKITLEAPNQGQAVADIDFFDLLDQLSAQNKDLLVNYYYNGLNMEEMVTKYEMSQASLFRKLSEARKQLKELYEKENK